METDSPNPPYSGDEYAQFAQMTGYQEQPSGQGGEAIPLLDQEDIEADDHAGTTQTQVWGNPFAKLAVVGGIFAIAVGGAGLFLVSANHVRQSVEAANQPTSTSVAVAPSTPTPVNEVGDLKTQTALETQIDAIHAANQPQPVASNPSPNPSVLHTPPVSPHIPPAVQAPPRYAPPAAAPEPPPRSSPATSSEPVDPMQAWQSAQQLGSYGQVEYASVQSPSSDNGSSSQASPVSEADGDYQQQQYQSDEDAILNGTVRQFSQVIAGSFTSGNLETPIVWAQDLDASQQPQRFAMTLSQPLMGSDGSVALPTGSVLILSVNAVDQSGLVDLGVNAAIVQQGDSQEVISIPPGALTVESNGNQPLIARQYNGVGHQIANMDRSLAIMGGLSRLGQFITSPSSSTTSQSLASTITSSTNRKVNAGTIIGSVLDGAFSSLDSQVSQRDTQEIRDLMNRPNVWYIPDGQTLQVFANSSFEVAS